MKRIISIILAICLLMSIAVVPAFASSTSASYTPISPSEEMQYMTSGSTPSTYAANDAGYRMELNGVEQSVSGICGFVERAPSGYVYLNDYLLPELPINVNDYPLCFLFASESQFWYYDSVSFYVSGDNIVLSNSFPYVYFLSSDGSSWEVQSRVGRWDSFNYSSYIKWISADVMDEAGNVVIEGGFVSAFSDGHEDFSYFFASTEYSNSSFVDRTLSLTGSPVTGEITGDQTYSFTATNPYIDVELPISAWVDEVPAAEDYWSVSIDGTLAFDLAIGLQGTVAGEDKSYYALSDLVPSSWQLICNGSLMEDSRCTGSFDSVAATTDGYHASLTMSTGELNLGSVSSGEYGVEPETLGFRIYLTSASGGAATTITNSYTFDSVTPYAYISFNDADGNSGLPSVTFYEDYASGTLSGSGNPDDYIISVYDLGFEFGYQYTASAASGNKFYGTHELPTLPTVSGQPYVYMHVLGSSFYAFFSSSAPTWNGSQLVFADTPTIYYFNSNVSSWTLMTISLGINDYSYCGYLNFNLCDSSGTILKTAMAASSTGFAPTSVTLVQQGALDNINPDAGYVDGYAGPLTYDTAGSTGTSFQYSNDAMTGYMDVTYPAEVFGVLSTNALLSLTLNGNLAVRARVFPAVVDMTNDRFGGAYYIDNPTSVQIIINDVIFSEEYPLNYITDDPSVASVSGLNLSFDGVTYLDTVTFRFNYTVDAQSTEWMTLYYPDAFAIGAECEILTSPVFTAEVDENAATRFDDTNIVNWLKKIHTELTAYLPQFSIHFQSIVDHLTTQTAVLNDILEAVKDNSAVESVSSTVTNIYNSISNVETSISNVESTINNVSNTVTEISGTMTEMQETQQEMSDTMTDMEEDSSALRDVYASEDDITLKENTSDLTSAVIENFFPGTSGDSSGDGSGSGSGTLNTGNVKSLSDLSKAFKRWFSFDVSFDDFISIVDGTDMYAFFTADTQSDIDSTTQTYSVRGGQQVDTSLYDEKFDILSGIFGGGDAE